MPRGRDDRAEGDRITAYTWYVLAILTAFQTVHTIDRNVVYVVLEPLKREFHLTDGEAGALGGLAHALTFAVTSVPLSWLADRYNRTKLLSVMAGCWGALTLVCGFATSASMLFLSRMGVGAAEGGTGPACLSLIADYFPVRRRATALAVYFLSAAIGTGGTFMLGAQIAQHYGWRAAFMVASIPTFLIALLAFFTLREPIRGRFDTAPTTATAKPSLKQAFGEILRTPPLLCGVIGLTLSVAVIAAFYAFGVSFFVRTHGMSLGRAALLVGLATGLAHGVGSIVGGPVADRLTQGKAERVGYFPATIVLLSIPSGALMLLGPSIPVSAVGLFLFTFFAGCWIPQGYAVPLALAPARIRGSSVGFTQVFTNLLGTGSGPALAGVLSDSYGNSLRYALLTMLSLYFVGAVFFVLASRGASARERARAPMAHTDATDAVPLSA